MDASDWSYSSRYLFGVLSHDASRQAVVKLQSLLVGLYPDRCSPPFSIRDECEPGVSSLRRLLLVAQQAGTDSKSMPTVRIPISGYGLYWATFMKLFIHPDPSLGGNPLSFARLVSAGAHLEALENFKKMDSFNPDAYFNFLVAVETYADQGRYLYGTSLLSVIPVFRFIWPEEA